MACASIIVGVLFFCAIAGANVTTTTLSDVGTQEVNETNPTVLHHLSADNDTTEEGAVTDVPENAQPPLTTRVTLPSGFSSTHPPLVHGRANIGMKEANVTSPPPMPMNINSNSMEHTTRSSSSTTPPPLVHPTVVEPTVGKSETSKAQQQGHNGAEGSPIHSSVILLFGCVALAKSYVTC